MATTDSNGILQLEVSDPVVPLQTALNGIGASVSSAMDSTVRTFKVANATARNNLATQRTPSKSDPLRVWRQDTGVYEINDGTGWRGETPAEPDPNIIRINGADYQRSGTLASIPRTPAFSTFGSTFARTIDVVLPFTPPAGWIFHWFTRSSTGYTTIERAVQETQLRIIQVGSNDVNALKTISWELVKV